jgi:hypothetical protein
MSRWFVRKSVGKAFKWKFDIGMDFVRRKPALFRGEPLASIIAVSKASDFQSATPLNYGLFFGPNAEYGQSC